MYALTVKQPWAQAIAQFGKGVENRTRRPPRQMLGQRIAIHVGQSVIDWQLMRDGVDPYHDHRFDLYLWATHGEGHRSESVPHAGRIIATARMVGYTGEASGARALPMYVDAVKAAEHSPWFTGPVGWVLADVVMLLDPVGPVVGRLGCWPLGPELVAQIQEQESAARGRR